MLRLTGLIAALLAALVTLPAVAVGVVVLWAWTGLLG
jgi:hypothetical protein